MDGTIVHNMGSWRRLTVFLLLLVVLVCKGSSETSAAVASAAGGVAETPEEGTEGKATINSQLRATPSEAGATDNGNGAGSVKTLQMFFDKFLKFAIQYPMVMVMVFIVLLRFALINSKIAKVEGSAVREIIHNTDWNSLMSESKEYGKYIIVDFYATWCPPCKISGPRFDQMSIDYWEKCPDLVFCKVDVDKHPDIYKACGIQAMPTFVLIKDAAQIEGAIIKGWSEPKLRGLLAAHGFRPPLPGKGATKLG